MTKPPCPAKAVLRKFNGAGAVDGDQAEAGAVDGDQAEGGAAQAGTAADGVGAKAGACPLASDMDLDTPVGATEAGGLWRLPWRLRRLVNETHLVMSSGCARTGLFFRRRIPQAS